MANDLGVATFAISQGVTAFLSLLPKLTDVRKADKDDSSFSADLRIGEIGATVITIGVGVIVTTLTGSKTTLVVSLFIAITMLAMYETVLRHDPIEWSFENAQ